MNSGRVIRWQRYFASPKDLVAAIVMAGILLVMLWYHPILTVAVFFVGMILFGSYYSAMDSNEIIRSRLAHCREVEKDNDRLKKENERLEQELQGREPDDYRGG